jgi:microcystin-dependent protein
MAGTIPLSMTQQFDIYGEPLAGGQLYLIQAGTVSTPQNGFQDLGLTVPLPNPITLDAAGRIPQFFLADGLIKVRLQDKNGVVQLASDGIQVIGPSSGGGGGGGLAGDPTQLWQTGDIKARYGTGTHPVPPGGTSPGWVRANGLTIGSATASPSATERGNADCQSLFQFLWPNTDLAVSGGRGASAAADWTANKTIATPDWRGRVISGLDDMGNVSANRLNLAIPGSTTLGTAGGEQAHQLQISELPAHTHSGTTGGMNRNNPHSHSYNGGSNGITYAPNAGVGQGFSATGQTTGNADINHEHTFTTDGGAGLIGGGHNTVQPTMLATIYIKL